MATVESLQGYTGQISEIAAQVRAAANIQHQVVHGGPTLDVLTEGGLVPSLARQAVLAQDKVNLALENVAVQLAGAMVYSTVALGLAATVNGAYFSVVSANASEYVTLYRNESGVAAPKKVYPSALIDALTVNRSKGYPLQSKTRAGVTSAESSAWNAFLLNIKVVNARPSEYYQVAYQANEASGNGFKWMIKKFDSATYESTGAGEVTLVALSDSQPQFIRAGGVQTVVLVPAQRPEMQFRITVDPTGLPPAGTPINSNSASGFAAWSWIIDESCYSYASEYKSPQVDTLSLNAGKVFPLNALVPRAGVINNDYQPFRDLFLDIEVSGVEAGKLYRVAYVASTAVTPVDASKANIGFRIEEFDKATYESSGTPVNIQNFTIPVGVVSRTGGAQTLTFTPASRSGMKIKITLDGSKIPADGQVYQSVNVGFPGRNWIIDESRYKQPAASLPAGGVQKMGAYFTYDPALKKLTYAYLSGSYAYRVTITPGAVNQLPDFNTIERGPRVTDLSQAVWSGIPGAINIQTDYLPPVQVAAVNDGDGAARIYTGGAHGAGTDGSIPTARNAMFSVFVDGQLLEVAASGYAESVEVMILNEIMAYNTVSAGRYVLQQILGLECSGRGSQISAEYAALEDARIYIDNGPQHYFGGFEATQMIPDSEVSARIDLSTSQGSGARSAYPKAWLLLTKSAYGTMASWVDRSYEAGDGRYVAETSPFIRAPGPDRAKFYHAIVAAMTANLAAGQSYKWRGGFHFFSDTAQTGFDTKAALQVGRRKIVTVTSSGVSRAV